LQGGDSRFTLITSMDNKGSFRWPIQKLSGHAWQSCDDDLAREEPLEIELEAENASGPFSKPVAITMRTPGHDRELALGFLIGEGLIRSLDQLEAVYGHGPRFGEAGWQNKVKVKLKPGQKVVLDGMERNFYMTSSCGVCGKTSLEALLALPFPPLPAPTRQIAPEFVMQLPEKLRKAQTVFDRTGGLHATGLFNLEGEPVLVREDVGRHNALDKVTGTQFLAGKWPLSNFILVVSGRASFELVQKALASGISMLVAVGAPSSLAVEAAERFGLTLVGFTKASGFNLYSGAARVAKGPPGN
jgi:FdhD protein